MTTLWDELGDWVDRMGDVVLHAADEVSRQSVDWLGQAMEGREPEEVMTFFQDRERRRQILRNADQDKGRAMVTSSACSAGATPTTASTPATRK